MISFTRARNPIHYDYNVDTVLVREVTKVKDPGILFSAELKFRELIISICKKPYRYLGLIICVVHGLTSIRSIVLYNRRCNIMLEHIQNKFKR